jgi:hypothetical protein
MRCSLAVTDCGPADAAPEKAKPWTATGTSELPFARRAAATNATATDGLRPSGVARDDEEGRCTPMLLLVPLGNDG